MALTPSKSTEYQDYSDGLKVAGSVWGAKKYHSEGTLTFTAVGTGTAQMLRLPPGYVKILTDESRIICPQGTANADLHVGNAAYTKPDGSAGAADDNSLADNLDVGGAAIDAALSLPASGELEFESRDGVDLEIMIDTANSPAAGDCILRVTYVRR